MKEKKIRWETFFNLDEICETCDADCVDEDGTQYPDRCPIWAGLEEVGEPFVERWIKRCKEATKEETEIK